MRLNEFADQRSYTLPPEEMAAILKLVARYFAPL